MKYIDEECQKCADGIYKKHRIIVSEKKLQCLECGNKQDFSFIGE